MLGEFVDDYTVQCVDVFAMPQSGTSVSVESVDPVFQQQMLEMLKQTGRYGMGRNFVVVRIPLRRSATRCRTPRLCVRVTAHCLHSRGVCY